MAQLLCETEGLFINRPANKVVVTDMSAIMIEYSLIHSILLLLSLLLYKNCIFRIKNWSDCKTFT